eukprot:5942373-Prorocentrum_lima.AAC.2
MNWIDSLPRGAVVNFGHVKNRKTFAWQCKVTATKNMYFPDYVFEGQILNLARSPLLIGEHTTVVALRKNDNKKRCYVGTLSTLDWDDFDAKDWSMILYYNVNGTMIVPQKQFEQ